MYIVEYKLATGHNPNEVLAETVDAASMAEAEHYVFERECKREHFADIVRVVNYDIWIQEA